MARRPYRDDAPSGLARKLAAGEYVVSVEIDPPRSIRIDRTVEAGRLLKEAGVDLVNVSDSATGRVRMGALAVAFGLQQRLGLECLIHLTTRDRNLMALEAELLGAHALGIRNVLALTGDPPRVADRPGATAVWDVDAVGLIGIVERLESRRGRRRRLDRAGRRLHDRLRVRSDVSRIRTRNGLAWNASSPPDRISS